MKISPARRAAFDILLRIEDENAHSSPLLQSFEERLSGADRGLCHQLVLGTLRRQIYLDRLLEGFTEKKLDVAVRIALRLGLYQLIDLDRVPPHAAINESVELVARAKRASARSFVNAILRRYQRENAVPKISDELDRISIETSHPHWLIEKWVSQFGQERAEAIARQNNVTPAVSFRLISDDLAVRSEWKRSSLARGAYTAEHFDDELRRLHSEGKIYFQDAASQAVAEAVEVTGEGRFLDVCAAPGGKTGLVKKNYPALFCAAGDLYQSRVDLLRRNLLIQGFDDICLVRYDATRPLPFPDQSFDAVLVDAPCSGTGTIRHNPEIRYSLSPDDISELALKQHAILTNASNCVKTGGLLVYSTCSLEREEGEDIATRFLADRAEFVGELPKVVPPLITSDGFARTWPDTDGADGFFVAAFRRV